MAWALALSAAVLAVTCMLLLRQLRAAKAQAATWHSCAELFATVAVAHRCPVTKELRDPGTRVECGECGSVWEAGELPVVWHEIGKATLCGTEQEWHLRVP